MIELFFRLGGFILNTNNIKSYNFKKSTTNRVLCIGDSSTYGIGASDAIKYSYPSQLQRLLDEKAANKNFEVINLGVPGINSSQVLNRFRNNIKRYEPELIIVMVGINDPWNLEESSIIKYYEANIFKKLFFSIDFLLNKLKTYQFFKLVSISNKFNKPRENQDAMFQSEQELVIPDLNDETISKGFKHSLRDPFKSIALYKAIENNIAEINHIAQENGITVIFMKYHNGGWGRPERAIHETYARLGTITIDNTALFREAVEKGLNIRGNDRWHPNDLGYKLIARNIYNKMVDLSIIDSKRIDIF